MDTNTIRELTGAKKLALSAIIVFMILGYSLYKISDNAILVSSSNATLEIHQYIDFGVLKSNNHNLHVLPNDEYTEIFRKNLHLADSGHIKVLSSKINIKKANVVWHEGRNQNVTRRTKGWQAEIQAKLKVTDLKYYDWLFIEPGKKLNETLTRVGENIFYISVDRDDKEKPLKISGNKILVAEVTLGNNSVKWATAFIAWICLTLVGYKVEWKK